MADQGNTKYIQIDEKSNESDFRTEVNRALRYTWEQLANLSGTLGTPNITADLDLHGFKAIDAADPKSAQDLVTKNYADLTYVAKSTSVNPGTSGTPADNPGVTPGGGGSSGITFTGSDNLQLTRWNNATSLGSAHMRDDDTYIIVGTGTTDAAVTANALVVGSSANAGDLAIVRLGVSSEMIRLLPTASGNQIRADKTGSGTYRDMVFFTNNTEAARFDTSSNFKMQKKLTLYNSNNGVDGQLLIGNTSSGAWDAATLTQHSANEVVITNAGGAITLGLPQAINDAANVIFATLSLSSSPPIVSAGLIGYGGTTAATASNGGGQATPANVDGYVIINVAGTGKKMPYYPT